MGRTLIGARWVGVEIENEAEMGGRSGGDVGEGGTVQRAGRGDDSDLSSEP